MKLGKKTALRIKRAMDVAGAGVGLVASSPVLLAASLGRAQRLLLDRLMGDLV